MWQDKNTKKKHSEGKNFWEDLWQRNYTSGQTSNMTKNIREEWRGIGDNGRARNP